MANNVIYRTHVLNLPYSTERWNRIALSFVLHSSIRNYTRISNPLPLYSIDIETYKELTKNFSTTLNINSITVLLTVNTKKFSDHEEIISIARTVFKFKPNKNERLFNKLNKI